MIDPRDQAIADNMRLVHATVRRHCKRWLREGYTYDDAISAGTIGLIKAIDQYEPESGCRLSTFATQCILNEVSKDAQRFRGIGFRQAIAAGDPVPDQPLSLQMRSSCDGHTLLDVIADTTGQPGADAPADPRLAAVLATMNEKDRIAVLHHDLLAADLLGVSRQTAQRRRQRAYAKARTALGVAS
jgi:RNA polymerase sigma factor (sigma-70 family)